MAERSTTRTPSLRFVAKAAFVVLAIWALSHLIWAARDILFIGFTAVLVAIFLSIFVDPLERWGMPRVGATLVVVLALLVLVAGAGALMRPTLQDQIGEIRTQLPEAVGRVQEWLDAQSNAVSSPLGDAADDVESELRERLRREVASLVGGTLPLLSTALGAVSGAFLVLFAGIFMTAAPRTYAAGLARLLPGVPEARTHSTLEAMSGTLRKWIQATAIGGLIVAALSMIGLVILGVPAPIPLGLFAGLMELVPYVGPFLSGIPAVAMALLVSPSTAVWVIGLYVVIQAIESNLILPLLLKGIVKLEPALTILFQAMMATLFGFLGLLLAVPILASVKALLGEVMPARES